MKKVNLFFIWILSISMIITSCIDEDADGRKASKLARMNIADAKLLFITSQKSDSKLHGVKKSSSLKSTSETGDEIYAIEYLDKNDKPIKEKIPRRIHDAGEFLIMVFEEWERNTVLVKEEVYFVRKTDGTVYEVSNEYIPISGYNELIFNSNINKFRFRYTGNVDAMDWIDICYDKNNKFYYTAIRCLSNGECPHILYQVSSISNSGINFKQVSADNETVQGFCIDDAGNAIYGLAGERWMRYVSVDGHIGEPIPFIVKDYADSPVTRYRFVWNGSDGIMALFSECVDLKPDGSYTIIPKDRNYLMKFKNGQFEKVREISLDFNGNNYPSSDNVFYVQGKVIYSHNFEGVVTLVNISNENSYREIPCPVEANIVINDELYNFDKNTFSLTHINIDNGTTSPIFALNKSVLSNYYISCIMDVTESSIMFGAYRLSDDANVVAKIGLDNVLIILQSDSGEVSTVMPLNP